MDEIQRKIEHIRKLILAHPDRNHLFELDTMLSVALEEVRRLKASGIPDPPKDGRK